MQSCPRVVAYCTRTFRCENSVGHNAFHHSTSCPKVAPTVAIEREHVGVAPVGEREREWPRIYSVA